MKKLSLRDHETIRNIQHEQYGADRAFKLALEHHANITSELREAERDFWDHVRQAYDLDPGKEFSTRYSNKERAFIIEEDVKK